MFQGLGRGGCFVEGFGFAWFFNQDRKKLDCLAWVLEYSKSKTSSLLRTHTARLTVNNQRTTYKFVKFSSQLKSAFSSFILAGARSGQR